MATQEVGRVANGDVIPIRPRTAVTHQVVKSLGKKNSALVRSIRSAAHNRQQSPNGRRSQCRFAITVEVEYKVGDSDRKIGRVVNLSSKGVLFAATDRLPVGKRIQLFIAWPMKLDGKVGLTLWATGQVIRSDGQHIAVHLSRHEFRTARLCVSGSV